MMHSNADGGVNREDAVSENSAPTLLSREAFKQSKNLDSQVDMDREEAINICKRS